MLNLQSSSLLSITSYHCFQRTPPGWHNDDQKGINMNCTVWMYDVWFHIPVTSSTIYITICGFADLSFPPLCVFQSVELQSLWRDQPVVLFFLRRFGCQVCRWMASEISKLEADLTASGVALVGIGPEEFGLKEFKEGGFFKGCKQYLSSSNENHGLFLIGKLFNLINWNSFTLLP